MAELEKILCTDSRIEAAKKINAIVDAMGEGDLANIDLSNLSSTGQAKFDEKAYANEVLKKAQITNCILEKPKYLNWTYEGGVITLKTGSKLMYPDGFNSDGSRKFSYYTTTKDFVWDQKAVTASLRYLWLARTGQYGNNFGQEMLYVGDTAPTLTGSYCLWYDTANNVLKNTSNKGETWQTNQGTFPFMTVQQQASEAGFKYPTSVFDGIGIMDSCVWVADGIKVLVPYGRNTDGTLKNTEVTSKASVHLAVWKVSTTATSPLFISTSGVLGNSGTRYVESETEPTFNYVLWYNPLTNEIKYKDSATSTWVLRRYAVVGFCYGTYGTPWANHFSYTEPNLKEAFRAVDYSEFEKLHVNNPHFFGQYIWSEFAPDNLSWLKSSGQWNSGNGYSAFYNWALAKANAGTSGFKLSTASYTDYDFVINTSAKTFRLPIKVQNAPNGGTAPVIGNGNGLGLATSTNTSSYYPIAERDTDDSEIFTHTARTSAIAMGTDIGNATGGVANGVAIGVSTNPEFSGLIADLSKATNSKLSLYFYVGETVRDEFLIDVAQIASNIANKVEVVEAYSNGTSWYRVYSADQTGKRFCLQGGVTNLPTTIALLKRFNNTNYTVTYSVSGGDVNSGYEHIVIENKTANSVDVRHLHGYTGQIDWEAKGYIS